MQTHRPSRTRTVGLCRYNNRLFRFLWRRFNRIERGHSENARTNACSRTENGQCSAFTRRKIKTARLQRGTLVNFIDIIVGYSDIRECNSLRGVPKHSL